MKRLSEGFRRNAAAFLRPSASFSIVSSSRHSIVAIASAAALPPVPSGYVRHWHFSFFRRTHRTHTDGRIGKQRGKKKIIIITMEEDFELEIGATVYLLQKGILNSFQITNEVNSIRGLLRVKITDGTATIFDLAKGITKELDLLTAVKSHAVKNIFDPETVPVLQFFLKRILYLLNYVHLNFGIGSDLLGDFLVFVNDNAAYLEDDKLDFLLEVVSETDSSKYSINNWNKLVEIYLNKNQFPRMKSIFEKAVESYTQSKTSNETVLPLWNLIIGHIKQYSSPSVLITLYEYGSKLEFGNDAAEIRCQYFKWFIENHSDIILIRTVFDNLKHLHPISHELYWLMIGAEESQKKFRLIIIRNLLIEACKHLGSYETCVWEKYIRFELEKKNPGKAKEVMREAVNCLQPDLKDNMCKIIVKIATEFKL